MTEKARTGSITVTEKDSSKAEEKTETTLLEPCKGEVTVGAECGLTINLGNFNSARYSASISLPCEDTPEAIAQKFKEAWDLITQEVNEKAKQTRKVK